jgi:hypothetical protein
MGTYVPNPDSGSFDVHSPWSQINDQTAQANFYATESFGITQTYIATLAGLLEDLVLPSTDAIDVALEGFAPIDYTARPSLVDVVLPGDWPVNTSTVPSWLGLPSFADVT